MEGDLLRRVVRRGGGPAPFPPHVGGHHRAVVDDLDHVAVQRAWTCWPISGHGTEYRHRPTLMWMSGPTLATDQVASTNGVAGSARRAGASTVANTVAGAAPSRGRQARAPATSWDQRTASACIAARLGKVRPRQNESRTYGIGRSTRGLSLGRKARTGSTSVS